MIRQQWIDPRLNHSLDHPITLPGDSKKFIWLPDTFFLNVRSATIHNVISENSEVSIRPGGVISYSTRLVFEAKAKTNDTRCNDGVIGLRTVPTCVTAHTFCSS